MLHRMQWLIGVVIVLIASVILLAPMVIKVVQFYAQSRLIVVWPVDQAAVAAKVSQVNSLLQQHGCKSAITDPALMQAARDWAVHTQYADVTTVPNGRYLADYYPSQPSAPPFSLSGSDVFKQYADRHVVIAEGDDFQQLINDCQHTQGRIGVGLTTTTNVVVLAR